MKKIKFMDCSFRDGFQSCLGARVKTEDFLPALEAAVKAGINHIEIGGGARFQALYFYCQEDAFEMMDLWRKTVGPDVNLQTLARGVNVVGLSSQSSDIIDLHAKLFKKHGITTIRNFDALNDVRNLDVSGRAIAKHGLKHQITVTMMGLAPNLKEAYAHTPKFYTDRLQEILDSGIPFDSLAFKDASGTSTPQTVYDTIKQARAMLGSDKEIQFHTHDTAGMAVSCNMAAIEAGADVIDLAMSSAFGRHLRSGHPGDVPASARHRIHPRHRSGEDPRSREDLLTKCMDKYFMPPESMQVCPKIIFSADAGRRADREHPDDARQQLPRQVRRLHRRDARSGRQGRFRHLRDPGFSVLLPAGVRATSVQGKNADGSWKIDPKGYGKMVLGYFGKTPAVPPDPDRREDGRPEQLGLEPTTKSVVEINDAQSASSASKYRHRTSDRKGRSPGH